MNLYTSTQQMVLNQLRIEFSNGESKTLGLQINESIFVGSGRNCEVVVEQQDVQAVHCLIWMDAEGLARVQDWNTRGRTLLNGAPVLTEMLLRTDDRIEVGDCTITPTLQYQPEPEEIEQVESIVEEKKVETKEIVQPVEAELPDDTGLSTTALLRRFASENQLDEADDTESSASEELRDVFANQQADEPESEGETLRRVLREIQSLLDEIPEVDTQRRVLEELLSDRD